MEKDIIKKIFLLNFPDSKIMHIKEFTEGYNNIAFDIKLDTGNFVLKVIKLGQKRKLALKQEKLKKLLEEKFKEFPIAKVIKSDYSKEKFDFPYIIIQKIEGVSLKKVYSKISNKEDIFEQVGELYGKIHSFNFQNYGELDLNLELFNEYSSWFKNKCEKIEKVFSKIQTNNNLTEEELDIHRSFYENNKNILNEETGPCLCHEDASDTNIIVSKTKGRFAVNGLIDFEFTRSSGAVEDLFSGFEFGDQKLYFKKSLIKGYSKYSKLPKNLENLTIFYSWMKNLNRISNIDSMSWRDLDDKKTNERKRKLRAKTLNSLKNIISNSNKN